VFLRAELAELAEFIFFLVGIFLCDLSEVGRRGRFLTPRHPRKLGWRGVSIVWPLRGLFLPLLRIRSR